MTITVDGSFYPFDLAEAPASWRVVYVGEVIRDIRPGFASGKHNQEGVGVPHLRPMNIDRQGRLDLTQVKYVSVENRLRLLPGDVLFNNTNSPVLIGKTTCITREGEWAFSNHMTRLRTPDGLNPKFVAYQLHCLWMQGYFLHRCVKHVNQASVSSSALAETVPLLVAPSAEQHRIVAEIEKHFTRLDAAVASLKRAQAKLKRYRASVLKAACDGRLVPTEAELARAEGRDCEPAGRLLERILKERRAKWEAAELVSMRAQGREPKNDHWKAKYKEPAPPDTTDVPEPAEGWVWASAEQCTVRVTDGEHITPKRSNSGVLLLSARNVHDGRLVLDDVDFIPEYVYQDLSKRLTIDPDDVLLSCSGTVGRSCVVPPGLKFSLVRSVAVLKPLFGMGQFLSYAIRSPSLQDQINSKKTQTAQSNIFQGRIKTLTIPLPPVVEQRRIVAEVDRRLSMIQVADAAVEFNLKRAKRLRQSILKRAFEGRLVVQDPNDEPASVLLARIRAEGAASDATKHSRRRIIRGRAKAKQLRLYEETEL